jgi:hypothetical protein
MELSPVTNTTYIKLANILVVKREEERMNIVWKREE